MSEPTVVDEIGREAEDEIFTTPVDEATDKD